MNAISKKDHIRVLMLGIVMLIGNSVYAMSGGNKYDLNDKEFREKFGGTYLGCTMPRYRHFPYDEKGKRYPSSNIQCVNFINAIKHFGSYPSEVIVQKTNEAFYMNRLSYLDAVVTYYKKERQLSDRADVKKRDEQRLQEARAELKEEEQAVIAAGYAHLIAPLVKEEGKE